MIGYKTPISSFTPASQLFDLMQRDFAFPLKNRLKIVPEVDMYRIKEDESIYNQAKTMRYDYQVYFDGEYAAGFNVLDHPQRARINVLKGLKKLYQEGKIHWNLKQYEIEEQAKKYAEDHRKVQREAKRKKPTTKEEKIVDIAVRKALKVDKKI